MYGFLALRGAGRFKPFMIEPLTAAEMEAAMTRADMGPVAE